MTKTTREEKTLPLVALRETVIFPEMIVPLQVGREKSVSALNAAVAEGGPIALVTQRQPEQEDIESPSELYGVGTLAKYGMLIWPLGMFIFLLIDRESRWWFRTPWSWLTVGVGLLFLTPPVVWNVRHDWVTFKHVARQTGASGEGKILDGNFFELVGSQLGVLGPGVAVILGGALVYAWGRQKQRVARPSPQPSPTGDTLRGEGSLLAPLGEGVNASRRHSKIEERR